MRDKILAILRLYLDGEIALVELEERVITLALSPDTEDFDPIDEVAVELSYLKDQVSDEAAFRRSMSDIVARHSAEARPIAI